MDRMTTKISWKIPGPFILCLMFWRYVFGGILQKFVRWEPPDLLFLVIFIIPSADIIFHKFLELHLILSVKKIFVLNFLFNGFTQPPFPHLTHSPPPSPLFNDQNLLSVTKVFCRCSLTLYTYVLAQALQNGTKFIQKLTIGFKNHMRNMRNFRQAVESPKSWNLMGFCPKNTFLQLKPIQTIYLTLLSTTCVKIHQITDVIFETTSHFSQHNPSVSFLLKHNILSRKEPIKVQFSDFQLLRLKLTKFLMSFFK